MRKNLGQLEFVVQVIAGFAALIPFIGAVETLKQTLDNEKFKMVITDPYFFVVTCMGVAYSANGNVYASIIAVVLTMYLLSLGKDDAKHGKFTFGYGTLLEMDADAAVNELKTTVPAMNPVVVGEFMPNKEDGRIQLLVQNNKVVKYRIG